MDRSKTKAALITLAAAGLVAIIAGLALRQGASFNRVLVMVGVIGLAVGLAGLAVRRIFADGFRADRADDSPPLGHPGTIGARPAVAGDERRLTDAQRRSLVTELCGGSGKVMIWASEDERSFARDFADAFATAGWQVKITYRVGGMGHSGYQIHRLRAHPEAAQPIISAMWVAGFAIDIVGGRQGPRGLEDFSAGLSLGGAA